MLWLLDRAAQLTILKRDRSCPEPLTCEAALETTALAAALLFGHGQTTERSGGKVGRNDLATVTDLPDFDRRLNDGNLGHRGATPWCSTVIFRRFEKHLIWKDFCAIANRWRRGRARTPHTRCLDVCWLPGERLAPSFLLDAT
jgi:hypothetical protein